MKTYEGKLLDEVLQKACQDLGVTLEELKYEITEEKKTLFIQERKQDYGQEIKNRYHRLRRYRQRQAHALAQDSSQCSHGRIL